MRRGGHGCDLSLRGYHQPWGCQEKMEKKKPPLIWET